MRRHKIDIIQNISGNDEYGEQTDDWQPFKQNIWADKQEIVGKEFYTSLTMAERIDAKFETGYFKGVKSSMRLKHGDDVYDIIGPPININDKNLKLLFYCKRVN